MDLTTTVVNANIVLDADCQEIIRLNREGGLPFLEDLMRNLLEIPETNLLKPHPMKKAINGYAKTKNVDLITLMTVQFVLDANCQEIIRLNREGGLPFLEDLMRNLLEVPETNLLKTHLMKIAEEMNVIMITLSVESLQMILLKG